MINGINPGVGFKVAKEATNLNEAAIFDVSALIPLVTDQDAEVGYATGLSHRDAIETDDPSSLETPQKVERAIAAISGFLKDGYPLAVAYSGGKDSSVMAALVLEAARRMKEFGSSIPQILFTHARTGIDNPAMDMVAKLEIERIRTYAAKLGLPVRVDIAEPSLNDSWAVRIISGRALPTFANSSTRDCAISWKLIPQKRQRKAAFKELRASLPHSKGIRERRDPIVLVGTRFEESSSRAARMSGRGELDTQIWIEEIRSKDGHLQRSENRLSPIAFWSQEDVWVFLSELSSGERQSYTDAKDIWDVYRDGGNSSCVVVADDAMKASAKACGARFGCALCTAVGRDKSLEAMLEADPKYKYLIPLNRLQRFLVDTQYDMSRRSWLGRTIQDDGYIAIAPDAYSPKMQRELLGYALTIDRDESRAAAKLGLSPRFQLITLEQLLAIDAIWSIQGYHTRPFEAIHLWEAVYEKGESFVPPEVDPSVFDKRIPKPKWLYIGNWDCDPGFNGVYTGARNLLADFSGSTEMGGCMQNIALSDGRVVMATELSDMLEIDSEGAELFMTFEVMDNQIHRKRAGCGNDDAFRYYQMLGTISTSKRHIGMIDDMLRRAAWKDRHGIFDMEVAELLSRSVDDVQRQGSLRAPPGVASLQNELAEKLSIQHDKRERIAFSFNNINQDQCVK
jgi:DNA sulfur modification protein DndC